MTPPPLFEKTRELNTFIVLFNGKFDLELSNYNTLGIENLLDTDFVFLRNIKMMIVVKHCFIEHPNNALMSLSKVIF